MSDDRHFFKIPIGDWSGDGHDKCRWFRASAAQPLAAVREAFFAAKQKMPNLDPGSFCKRYGDYNPPSHVVEVLRGIDASFDPDDFNDEWMVRFVAWFINQGADVDVQIEPDKEDPMLPFYGYDGQGRHIGHIGYGLMSP